MSQRNGEDADPAINDPIDAHAALEQVFDLLQAVKQSIVMPDPMPVAGTDEHTAKLHLLAHRMVKMRRLRTQFLPAAYFDEPAFDMLLDLFIADVEGRRVFVHDACVASMVPISTALRWISILVRDKLVKRQRDQEDLRRSIIAITPQGRRSIRDLLAASAAL